MTNYTQNIILTSFTIRQALERLNTFGGKEDLVLFVVDDANILVGTITDGDIRRALLRGVEIKELVTEVMFLNFRFLNKNNIKLNDIKKFRNSDIGLVPILDESNQIFRIINFGEQKTILPVTAVLMAGGKGERLRPLTESIPKPLLKIGNKPIIEYNVDRLIDYGVSDMHISLRYLAEQVVHHFETVSPKEIQIQYVYEDIPLGTIGSLSNIEQIGFNTVLLMNSDLLTNIDFEDFYADFEEQQADMSIATTSYHVNVPYAVLETTENNVTALKEKPTYTYYSNAGIYLIKKEWVDLIPPKIKLDATDFIEELIERGCKVIQYPILGYWLDIGKPEDYKKAQDDIKHIKF